MKFNKIIFYIVHFFKLMSLYCLTYYWKIIFNNHKNVASVDYNQRNSNFFQIKYNVSQQIQIYSKHNHASWQIQIYSKYNYFIKKIKFTPNSIIIFGINLTLLANIILLCWVTNLIYSKYNYVC